MIDMSKVDFKKIYDVIKHIAYNTKNNSGKFTDDDFYVMMQTLDKREKSLNPDYIEYKTSELDDILNILCDTEIIKYDKHVGPSDVPDMFVQFELLKR